MVVVVVVAADLFLNVQKYLSSTGLEDILKVVVDPSFGTDLPDIGSIFTWTYTTISMQYVDKIILVYK